MNRARAAGDGTVGVMIVDDDKILCDLLLGRLDDENGLACVGMAMTPNEARLLAEKEQPRVILVDISLGPGIDAISLVADLAKLSPASQILIWTKWTDSSVDRDKEFRQKVRASRAGASDWIVKGRGINNLIDRIREAVGRGPASRADEASPNPIEAWLGNSLGGPSPLFTRSDASNLLTPAEDRAAVVTARGLESGMTVEQIARSYSMKVQTLRSHLKKIYQKWGVHGQAEFVAEARRRGIL